MIDFKELSRMLNLRRLGESWRRKGVREYFISDCKELGRLLDLKRLGEQEEKRRGIIL